MPEGILFDNDISNNSLQNELLFNSEKNFQSFNNFQQTTNFFVNTSNQSLNAPAFYPYNTLTSTSLNIIDLSNADIENNINQYTNFETNEGYEETPLISRRKNTENTINRRKKNKKLEPLSISSNPSPENNMESETLVTINPDFLRSNNQAEEINSSVNLFSPTHSQGFFSKNRQNINSHPSASQTEEDIKVLNYLKKHYENLYTDIKKIIMQEENPQNTINTISKDNSKK